MRQIRIIGAIAVAVLVGTMTAGIAHEQTKLDPDDSPGPLDLVATQHRHRTIDFHGTGPGRLVTSLTFKVVTYETWSYEAIGGGRNFVAFEIDVDLDRKMDRCIVVHSQTPTEGAARGYEVNVYEGCNYFDDRLIRSFGTENVRRPDEHSIRVVLGRRAALGPGVKSYGWRAVTSFEEQNQDGPCPAPDPHGDGGYGTCADFTGWKTHKR